MTQQNAAVVVDTPSGIEAFQMLARRGALSLEAKGMRRSRGPSVLSIVKKLYGIKARTAAEALPKYEQYLRDKGVLIDKKTG